MLCTTRADTLTFWTYIITESFSNKPQRNEAPAPAARRTMDYVDRVPPTHSCRYLLGCFFMAKDSFELYPTDYWMLVIHHPESEFEIARGLLRNRIVLGFDIDRARDFC